MTLPAANLVKALCVGQPGTGKTGSLAALANTGKYNIRILDYDYGLAPLMAYVDKKYRKNIDVVTLEDEMCLGALRTQVRGPAVAFEQGLKMIKSWKHDDVDLGSVYDWGENDILVLDSLTSMGKAAMNYVMCKTGRNGKRPADHTWGDAISVQEDFLGILKSPRINCHVIVTAHLKLVGPKEGPRDDDAKKEVNEQIRGIVPFRLCPTALGQQAPQRVGALWPYILYYKVKSMGPNSKRMILTTPQEHVDVKVPLAGLPKELPIEDGLLKIFEAAKGA